MLVSIKIFSLVCCCWTQDLGFRALGWMKPTHAISWSSISVFFIYPNKSYSYFILSKGSIISKELNCICLISIHCNLLWTKVCRVLYSFIELCLLMMLQFNYTAFSLIVMLPFKFIKSINITVYHLQQYSSPITRDKHPYLIPSFLGHGAHAYWNMTKFR